MPTPAKPKVTWAMQQVLINIGYGSSPLRHVKGRSQFGGYTRVVRGLLTRGLITSDMRLTHAGRKWLVEFRKPKGA